MLALCLIMMTMMITLLSSLFHSHSSSSSPCFFVSAASILSNTSLAQGIDHIECSCSDEFGHVFVGQWSAPGAVSKVNMSNMRNLGTLYLNRDEDYVSAIAYDFNGFIYASTYSSPTAFVVKVQTRTMNRVGHIALPSRDESVAPDPSQVDGQLHKISAAFFMPTPSNTLLFATDTSPSRILKVPISDFTYKQENVYTLQNREDAAVTFVASRDFLLVGLQQKPAIVVKLDPTTLQRQGSLTFNSGEDYITHGFSMTASAPASTPNPQNPTQEDIYNPSNSPLPSNDNIFYFLCYTSPAKVVKVEATISGIIRLAALTLGTQETRPRYATPIPFMNMFIIGLATWPGIVVAVDPRNSMTRLYAKWVPTSDRYFSTSQMITPYYHRKNGGAGSQTTAAATTTIQPSTTTTTTMTSSPSNNNNTSSSTTTASPPTTTTTTTIIPSTTTPSSSSNLAQIEDPYTLKIFLGTDSAAASAVQFLPSLSSTTAQYSTANMLHFNGGESLVSTAQKFGDHLFLVSDARPAIAVKLAIDTLQTLGTLRLPLGDDWIRAFVIDKFGFGHLAACTTVGRLIRFDTVTMQRISSIDGTSEESEQCFHTAVFAPTLETTTQQILYVSSYYGGSMIKFAVTASGITRLARTTSVFPERVFTTGAVPPSLNSFAIYGTFASTGQIVKMSLSTGTVSDTLSLPSGEGTIRDATVFGNYGYFSVSPTTVAPGIVKVSIGTANMFRISKFNFGLAESFYSIVSLGDGTALLGTASYRVIKVDLNSGRLMQTISTKGIPGVIECGIAAVSGSNNKGTLMTTTTAAPSGGGNSNNNNNDMNSNNLAWMMSYSSPTWLIKMDSSSASSLSSPSDAISTTALIGGVGGGIGFLLLLILIAIVLKRNNNANKRNYEEDDNNNGQPMLQVPRTNVTIVHSAMSVPSRDDMMYSDRVAVPPSSGGNHQQQLDAF